MNELQKLMYSKKTENGDKSFSSTGKNLIDLFFMTAYFENHLDEVKIGTTEREKLFAMFVRDPRYGLGRRDLGRKLMEQAEVSPLNIIKAGRFDDLWHIPTEENLNLLKNEVYGGNELAKKWMPRFTKEKAKYARAICDTWNIKKYEYRKLIKTESVVEYKLSYTEKIKKEETPLNDLFNKSEYEHPLIKTIDFEEVPSLAMKRYLKMFSTREDIKPRFDEYMKKVKENKAKINVSTTNVYDAYKITKNTSNEVSKNADILGKKIVDNATIDVEMDAIVILDTSGSMHCKRLDGKANSIAHGLATHSTYAPNQVISFSSRPRLMTIKGETLKEQYNSMYTGECSITDFGKVMELLRGLNKFPQFLIVLSDMEFDVGSYDSKEETMRIFKEYGAETKIIWWNLNNRNKTAPEVDEYGNIYLSGYNLQILKLLENKFNMETYIDTILEKYKKDIDYQP